MVNKLSVLANFLEDQSVPLWVKEKLRDNREAILHSLEGGKPYILRGPNGETLTIEPDTVAA